jgi:hypothetical protein
MRRLKPKNIALGPGQSSALTIDSNTLHVDTLRMDAFSVLFTHRYHDIVILGLHPPSFYFSATLLYATRNLLYPSYCLCANT